MQKGTPQSSNLSVALWLLLTGLGIGWLIGLSVSPVVAIVITSVTGVAAAIVAALSGLEEKADPPDPINKGQNSLARWQINPLPLAMLVLGIGVGSAVGVWARNHSWLGSAASSEVSQWVNAGLTDAGWTQAEITRKLFESRYLASATITNTATSPASANSPSLGTYLFATNAEECIILLAAAKLPNTSELQAALATSTLRQLQQLPVVITDTTLLKQVVEQVLCADGR